MKVTLAHTLLGLAVVLLATSPVAAQAKKSDSVVKITAKGDKPDADGNQTVFVTLDIEKKWHLYANPVANEDQAPNQTTLKFVSKVEDSKIVYPPGKLVKGGAIGDYKTYEGKIEIKATVKRAKGDGEPLQMSLKVQACDDSTCLVPATVKLSVP